MSENGEIYTAGKNFTLPPALTAWTNSTSGGHLPILPNILIILVQLHPKGLLVAAINSIKLKGKRQLSYNCDGARM